MPRKLVLAEVTAPAGLIGPLVVDRITRNTRGIAWSMAVHPDWPTDPAVMILRARVTWDSGHYAEWVYGGAALALPSGEPRASIGETISVPEAADAAGGVCRSRVTRAELMLELFVPLTTTVTVEAIEATP